MSTVEYPGGLSAARGYREYRRVPSGSGVRPESTVWRRMAPCGTPSSALECPKGTLEYPKGTLECPKGTLECPKGTLECPKGTLECPKGTLEYPKGTLEYPKGTTRRAPRVPRL